MSALGQKQTYVAQKAMSALRSIATAKADFRARSRLLYPQKRTCAVQLGMSALGHHFFRESAFAVAIGGKADMLFCTAHVR
jgi:hypothetical protein